MRNDAETIRYPLQLPDALAVPPDIDGHVYVLDPAQDLVVETYQARLSPPDLVSNWITSGQLTDSGVMPVGAYGEYRGTRAYGGSGIAGLIRRGELAHGIHHALGIKVPGNAMNRNGPGGRCYITEPRVRNLAVALQQYGAYVVDGNTNINFNGFPGCVGFLAEWDDPDGIALGDAYEQLGRTVSLLQVVANNTPESVGGGGAPRTCFAPPLD